MIDNSFAFRGSAMSTTIRRKRYSKKAVLLLEMICKKNRKALKELQVKTEKRKIDLSDHYCTFFTSLPTRWPAYMVCFSLMPQEM